MADPVIVACPADTWTKVATNQTSGFVHIKTGYNRDWNQTYRDTGGSAPTDLSDAVKFLKPTEVINASAGIDVYVMPVGGAGSVRVDL